MMSRSNNKTFFLAQLFFHTLRKKIASMINLITKIEAQEKNIETNNIKVVNFTQQIIRI